MWYAIVLQPIGNLDRLPFRGLYRQDNVVVLLVELHSFDIVKHRQ